MKRALEEVQKGREAYEIRREPKLSGDKDRLETGVCKPSFRFVYRIFIAHRMQDLPRQMY
jgi:hypothetical protein